MEKIDKQAERGVYRWVLLKITPLHGYLFNLQLRLIHPTSWVLGIPQRVVEAIQAFTVFQASAWKNYQSNPPVYVPVFSAAVERIAVLRMMK